MSLRRLALGAALVLAGLAAAVGIGLLANTISGDSVGLSAQPLSAGDTLAPPASERRREARAERAERRREAQAERRRAARRRAERERERAATSDPPATTPPATDVPDGQYQSPGLLRRLGRLRWRLRGQLRQRQLEERRLRRRRLRR